MSNVKIDLRDIVIRLPLSTLKEVIGGGRLLKIKKEKGCKGCSPTIKPIIRVVDLLLKG